MQEDDAGFEHSEQGGQPETERAGEEKQSRDETSCASKGARTFGSALGSLERALRAVRNLAHRCVRVLGQTAGQQWRFGLTAVAALLMIAAALTLRLQDASSGLEAGNRMLPAVGVYSSVSDMSFLFVLDPAFEWPVGWTLRATPGDPWTGSLTWIGFSSEYAHLDLKEPTAILIALPPGARLSNSDPLRYGFPEACATWYDGQNVGSQPRSVVQSVDGGVFVGCVIPAVGEIEDLFIEVDFEWQSAARSSAGFARMRDAISFPVISDWIPSDAQGTLPGAVDELQYGTVRQPLEFILELPPGDRLLDAFPMPIGGGLQERSWDIGSDRLDTDIEILIETPGERVWVQPATESLLLLGGVLLGLLPLAWTRGLPAHLQTRP